MKPKLIIVGAGGHGKVVYDAVMAENKYEVVGFTDATLPVDTNVIDDKKVIVKQADLMQASALAEYFIVAIGNNKVRNELSNQFNGLFKLATVTHPNSVIGSHVRIGEGTVVLAGSVINASCVIGNNVIVNAGVIVDHDCVIGNHIHLSIGTLVGSNSSIQDGVTTTIGQAIHSFSKL